ncbi:MAG: polysulfide reductase NrfD [Gemmatimonadota bacterium]|nr:polysulfide reductase NrfD [Gemmatimonadota bacterium]
MSLATSHQEAYRRAATAPVGGLMVLGAALAVFGLGLFVLLAMGDDPARAWRMFLVNFVFFTGLAAGAVIFAAAQKITKGVWAGSIIRFAEAGVAFLPVALVLFLVLFLGREHVFPWIEHPTPSRGKWLTVSWVFWRDLVSLLVVCGVAIAFVWQELKPDVAALRDQATGWRQRLYARIAGDYDGSPAHVAALERRINRLAPILCLLYAYVFSLLAFDLIMSLAPYWYSNLFGAYYFMGSFLTGLTMLGLMMVYWRRRLRLTDLIGRQQFHDLGKLIFALTVFWAYLTYSHVLVIWYGNLPEETAFLFFRMWGEWRPVAVLVLMMVFVVPFWGLIWVRAKITPFTFALFAVISTLGMWLERFLQVEPSFGGRPAVGLPEIGISLGFLGLFLLAYGLFARAFPMVSPRLAERALALGHH